MMYALMLLILLSLIVITAITPYITRKTESFGVSIPSDFYNSQVLKEFRKQYATQSTVVGLIFIVILGLLSIAFHEEVWVLIYTAGIFLFLIITFIIYLQFHKKMKQLKAQEKWSEKRKEVLALDTSFYQRKLIYSNGWFLIPFIVTVITTIWTFLNYERFPDRLPMQYNLSGDVNTWADKSVGTLFMFPLLQLFMLGLFFFMNTMIARSKQQLDPAHPEQSMEQNIIFRRRWSLFMIMSGTALICLFSLPQFTFIYPIDAFFLFIIIITVTVLIVIGAIVLTVMTGQGGSRIRVGVGNNGEQINRDDDQYWKLGVFYFNPNDPAVWIEKRFGSGWTTNFARPTAWIFLIAIILIPILISLFTS